MEILQAEEKKELLNKPRYEGQSRTTYNPKTNKQYDKKPSQRMKRAFNALITGEAKTDKEALLIGGYPVTTAKRNANVLNTKAWQRLLDEHLADEELTTKHNQLLNSKNENIGIKALDLAYKVKNKYSAEEKTTNITNILNILQN